MVWILQVCASCSLVLEGVADAHNIGGLLIRPSGRRHVADVLQSCKRIFTSRYTKLVFTAIHCSCVYCTSPRPGGAVQSVCCPRHICCSMHAATAAGSSRTPVSIQPRKHCSTWATNLHVHHTCFVSESLSCCYCCLGYFRCYSKLPGTFPGW